MAVAPMNANLQRRRSIAFDRVRRAFWWTTASAFGAAGVIMGVVAHQIPGHRGSPTSATGAGSSVQSNAGGAAQSSTSGSSQGSAGAGSLSPPATTPSPSRQIPTAVSGGTSW